ncbi:response regulator receiver protein [Desulforapulum autotrophicum HRM2]|uniref:Response regulator receiver protein n=1 Tax=Desulforapulum autotrophicum (strain ATCC 43914 / DSM 3382 / VKM B-1955 / HRM2) TaxID=177437 RepID=C0QC61_DESAH|nr:response regulator [Desulforapulum autotrophicum]ACN17078.1 response regulator receiver protein [Desulforapulum autotrophicum HRM2]
MTKPFHILVTDTNLHVRSLLKRELEQDGHTIYMAKNKKEAHGYIYGSNQLDIIVLDPELPDFFGQSLLDEIQDRIPPVKIIIHTFAEFFNEMNVDENIYFVEKSANSIAPMKKKIESFGRNA